MHRRLALVLVLSCAVGAMDALTGALLIGAPDFALRLFGVTLAAGDEIWMRFIGAFVLGVGLSYLAAVTATAPSRRLRRLAGVWYATALVRASVGIFVIGAIVVAQLELAWLMVGATDGAVAVAQMLLLRAGWLDE